MLSITELYYHLKNYQITFSNERFLSSPDNEIVESIYTQLARKCLNCEEEDLSRICIGGLQFFQGEQDEAGIIKVNTLNLINRLMMTIGIDDFSLIDILYPDQRKTQKIISAAIKFLQFQESEFSNYQVIIQKNEELEEKLQKNKRDYYKEKEDFENLQVRKERELPIFKQLQSELEQEVKLLQAKEEEQNKIDEENDKILERKNKLAKQNENLSGDISQLDKQIAQIEEKIVKSPHKISQKIALLEVDIANEKETINQLDKDIQILIFKKEANLNFNKAFRQNCYNPALDLKEKFLVQTEINKELKNLQGKQKILDEQYNSLIDEIANFTSQIEKCQLKIEEIDQLSKEKQNEQDQKLKELLSQKKEIQSKVDLMSQQIHEFNEMIQLTEERKEKKQQNIKQQTDEHEKFIKYMIENITQYNQFIQNIFEDIQGNIEE